MEEFLLVLTSNLPNTFCLDELEIVICDEDITFSDMLEWLIPYAKRLTVDTEYRL